MSHEADVYARLQREVMACLRAAHTDWTEEVFESYEVRFRQLVRSWLARTNSTPAGRRAGGLKPN